MQSARSASASAEVVAALRFAMVAAAAGAIAVALGAVWMSTCTGGTGGDPAACGPIPTTALGLCAPLMLLAAAAWAFWRGHVRRDLAWHAAGAVLLMLSVAALAHG
ncbi:MAG: hypothetical protein HY239_14135 [Mycolicibacterium aromaticivorans]|nr:hypothetical protein [Mycolicibacterium aromaticivorans]